MAVKVTEHMDFFFCIVPLTILFLCIISWIIYTAVRNTYYKIKAKKMFFTYLINTSAQEKQHAYLITKQPEYIHFYLAPHYGFDTVAPVNYLTKDDIINQCVRFIKKLSNTL